MLQPNPISPVMPFTSQSRQTVQFPTASHLNKGKGVVNQNLSSSPSGSPSSSHSTDDEELREIDFETREAMKLSHEKPIVPTGNDNRQSKLRRRSEGWVPAMEGVGTGGKAKRGEKRKMQNRLAQRAFRARTKVLQAEVSEPLTVSATNLYTLPTNPSLSRVTTTESHRELVLIFITIMTGE